MPSDATVYDLTGTAFRADPFPTYSRMRREAPIYAEDGSDHPLPWMRGRVWYLLRYGDCVDMLRDSKRFVKDFQLAYDEREIGDLPTLPRFAQSIADSLIAQEAPTHTRLRRLVSEPFSVPSVEGRRRQVERIVDDLLDRVQDRGEMDLIADLAFRLPMTVITTLLGLPPEDGDQLRLWVTNVGAPQTPEDLAQTQHRMGIFYDYLMGVFEQRRREPQDDLISTLLSTDEPLSDNEMMAMIMMIVASGFETTMGMIGNAVLTLIRHPEAMERLRRDPALIGPAFEELQRYEGSVYTSTPRWLAEDVELYGHNMRRGERILAVILSANRDEEHFPKADQLDFDRRSQRQIGFGVGPHFCLGGPLAKLEVQVAISAVLSRLPGLRLATDERDIEWLDSLIVHGPSKMRIRWDTA